MINYPYPSILYIVAGITPSAQCVTPLCFQISPLYSLFALLPRMSRIVLHVFAQDRLEIHFIRLRKLQDKRWII